MSKAEVQPNCAACGAGLTPGAGFCVACGRPVEASPTAPETLEAKCAFCGAAMRANSKFCGACGREVQSPGKALPAESRQPHSSSRSSARRGRRAWVALACVGALAVLAVGSVVFLRGDSETPDTGIDDGGAAASLALFDEFSLPIESRSLSIGPAPWRASHGLVLPVRELPPG